MPSHVLVGDPQATWVPILFRLFSQLREVKGPSAGHGALTEDRYGHWPHAPSPELQRTGR